MWTKSLSVTPFVVNGAADCKFGCTIPKNTWLGDNTFVSTLRATLADRLGENGKEIEFRYYELGLFYGMEDFGWYPATDYIQIYTTQRIADKNEELFSEKAKTFFEERGFQYVDKATEYFKKIFTVMVFVKPETRESVVVVRGMMDIQKKHLLASVIPVLVPWFYPEENPVREWEYEMFQSLQEPDPTHYLEILEKRANELEFRDEWLDNSLRNFQNRGWEQEIENNEREIENIYGEMKRLQDSMNQLNKKRITYNTMILGLRNLLEANDSNEIADYFKRSKFVYLRSVSNTESTITFFVRDELRFWGCETGSMEIQDYIDNDKSFLYRPEGHEVKFAPETIRKFWDAVLNKREIRIKMWAGYILGTDGTLDTRDHSWDEENVGYIYNPHIYYHRCFGEYRPIIRDSLFNGDFIGAIEACISSARSINFDEVSPTASPWVKALYSTKSKCVILPDGKEVSPKDAMKWIEEGGLDNGEED